MSSPTTSSGSDERFETALCGPDDRAEQARLFSHCFKKPIETTGLVWRYDENPHGVAVSAVTRPIEPVAGEGVSGYACSPRRALVRGDESTLGVVGETGDVMTHPDWRKRGLFSELDRRVMRETATQGWVLAFGLPNRRSAHIFQQLGWETIGTIRPWTHVLVADAAARAARFGDGRLARLCVPWHARAGRKARARLARAGTALTVRSLEAFPAEVEALSRAVEPAFGFMVRRDADYLNWRFGRSPSGLHRVLGVFRARALAGYVVVQVPRAGEAVGYLVDVLAPEADARAAAIAAGLDELERAGASVVQATAIDGSWWAERLREAGFQRPKPENHLIVILHPHQPDHPLVAAARDTSRWYLTDGDRDDETMG